jgi:hypothetical protein
MMLALKRILPNDFDVISDGEMGPVDPRSPA